MGYLTKAQILEVQDLPVEDVHVPEWGGMVRVRGLTGAERDRWELEGLRLRGQRLEMNPGLDNFRARLVALCVIDEAGERLFSDRDVPRLSEKSGAVLDRLFDVARRLSGLTAADVDDLEKNSPGGQSGDSGSD